MIIFIYFKNVFFFQFQEKALTVFPLAYEKAVALGYKLDITFYQIRITSYELMDYKTFVTYTVLASMIALERVDLRQKVGYQSAS